MSHVMYTKGIPSDLHTLTLCACSSVQDKRDDQAAAVRSEKLETSEDLPIKPQYFGKNEYKHHADKDPGLLHIGSDTLLGLV